MQTESDVSGGPRDQLRVLVRLQEIDAQRDRHRKSIETSEELIEKRRADVARAAAELERARAELKRLQAEAHAADVDLREQEEKIRKSELDLNTAKTNQEYRALQEQIARLRGKASEISDRAIELLEAVDAHNALIERLEQALREAESRFEEYRRTILRDREEAEKAIAESEAKRAELEASLPPDVRETYARLRKARAGRAVVPVEGTSCGGCGVRITPNSLAKLRALSTIVVCDSCQRILYDPQAFASGP